MMRRAINFLCRFLCWQPQRQCRNWDWRRGEFVAPRYPTVVYSPPQPIAPDGRARMAILRSLCRHRPPLSASRLDDVIPIGKPAADIILSRSRRGRLTQKQPGPLKNSKAANIAKLPEFLPIHVDR
jgi:hypothetical protein